MLPANSALVTGATGFIGRRLVDALRAAGVPVVAGLHAGSKSHAPEGILDAIDYDLTGDGPIELPAGIDTIYHLAGKAHAIAELSQDPAEYARVNREGTRRLLEAARRSGARAFVFFSSVKAAAALHDRTVGQSERRALDETDDAAPDSAYGRSKREAEELVLRGGYVPHPVVLRPSLVYGPGVVGNIEKMIEAVRRGRFPPVPEVGNKRSMVHADDLIAAAILAAKSPKAAGQIYIVADNGPCSTRELFVWMCEALGRRVPGWTVPAWSLRGLAHAGDMIGSLTRRRFVFDSQALDRLVGDAWYSSRKLQERLGWVPHRTIRESLAEMV